MSSVINAKRWRHSRRELFRAPPYADGNSGKTRTAKQRWTAVRERNKVAAALGTLPHNIAAELQRALERTSRSRSYSRHTALSRTAGSSHINQAVRTQRAAIPAVYAGARRAARVRGSRRECVRSSVIGSLSDWSRLQPPCCHHHHWPLDGRQTTSIEERLPTWSLRQQLQVRHHRR